MGLNKFRVYKFIYILGFFLVILILAGRVQVWVRARYCQNSDPTQTQIGFYCKNTDLTLLLIRLGTMGQVIIAISTNSELSPQHNTFSLSLSA